MKHQIVLLFSLLLSSFLGSSLLLVPPNGPRQGEMELNVMNDDKAIVHSSSKLKDEMEELMGSMECYEKDEECFSRRMVAEAHLDYIYTQQTTP